MGVNTMVIPVDNPLVSKKPSCLSSINKPFFIASSYLKSPKATFPKFEGKNGLDDCEIQI